MIKYCTWCESCCFVGQIARVFNFILNLCSSSKQFREASTEPNHYKMVINCNPNIQNMRERERERERLWVERWGKEIELEEVYGYGCLGKEIYCIPYQFHPFHSFPLVLFFPLFSPICVSVCLVNQQYFFFPSIPIDFISEISFHFPLPCVVIHESFYDSQFFMITFVNGCHRRSFKEDYIGSLETTKTPIKSKACLKSAFRVFINDLFWKKKLTSF